MRGSFTVALYLFLIAVGPTVGADTVGLTDKDDGGKLMLRNGEHFSLVLRQNITTGYSWRVASSGEPVLGPAGEPVTSEDAPLRGAGGTITYRFVAKAEGTTTLRLEYARPWEKETRPAKTFQVTVTVAR